METICILIICITVSLVSIAMAYTLNNYCIKKKEFAHKIEIEKLRMLENKEKTKYLDDKENLKNELETSIKESFKDNISKLVNEKIDATITERIKTLEDQIKLLAIKTKK